MSKDTRADGRSDFGRQLRKDVVQVVMRSAAGVLTAICLAVSPILAMQLEMVINADLSERIRITASGMMDVETGQLRAADELQFLVDSMTGPQTPARIQTELWVITADLATIAHSYTVNPTDPLPEPFLRDYELSQSMWAMTRPTVGVPASPPIIGIWSFGKDASGATISALPLSGNGRDLQGYLVYRARLPALWQYWLVVLAGLAVVSVVPLTLALLIADQLSRRMARVWAGRFEQFGSAASAWAQGDVEARIKLPERDPLEPIGGLLNQVADRFERIADARTALALSDERSRMARELHDAVKQNLFAASLQIGAAQTALRAQNGSVKPHLDEARRLTAEAQTELTGLIRTLRPAALQGQGLAPAVRAYAVDWSRQTGIAAEVKVDGEREIPFEIENSLFRVAQEALANADQHSGARRVELHLSYQPGTLLLRVRDDGCGFDPQTVGPGFGLRSMRERLTELGGDLSIESGAGRGVTVLAAVPVPVVVEQT